MILLRSWVTASDKEKGHVHTAHDGECTQRKRRLRENGFMRSNIMEKVKQTSTKKSK